MTDSQAVYQKGIQAIRAGDLASGGQFLKAFLRKNPDHASAWLWLTRTTDSRQMQQRYIDRVLEIQPDHPKALELQQKLNGSKRTPSTRPNVKASKSDHPFGELIASFGANMDELWGNVLGIIIVVAVIGGIAFLFRDEFGFLTDSNRGRFLLFLMPVLIGYALLKALWMSNQKLNIYQNGFEHTHLSRRHWLWSDITRLQIKSKVVENRMAFMKINTMHEFEMRIFSGKKRIFKVTKDYKDVEHLCNMISSYVDIEPEQIS